MKTLITHLSTKELLNYREFDRVTKPAPMIPFIQAYTVDQVAEWMVSNPESMEPLELSIYANRALLTDGNHRIAAANKLGIKTMPVKVIYYETFDELSSVLYPQSIRRFKKLN